MPRIRSIKPEITTDRKFAGVSRAARYTFVMLIAQSDDDGLILGSPRQLLGTLYPHDDDVTLATLSRELRELLDIGVIRQRETTDGAPVIEISNWAKHQRIDHKGKSLILPLLTPFSCEPREGLATPSRDSRAPTVDHRALTKTFERGSLTASNGDAIHAEQIDVVDESFEAAWKLYPSRGDHGNPKGAAFKAWRARVRSGVSVEELTNGVTRYAAFIRAKGTEGTEFVKQASTFFGPQKFWLEPWTPPTQNGHSGSSTTKLSDSRAAIAKWMEH